MDTEPCYNTPREELIIGKCWVPECRNIVAFEDGMGWQWCITHQDRGQWGIYRISNYDEIVKKIRTLIKEK